MNEGINYEINLIPVKLKGKDPWVCTLVFVHVHLYGVMSFLS